jgi:hypothetical protein
MSLAVTGWKACVGLTEEVTWGTAVSPPTHWLGLESSNLKADAPLTRSPLLRQHTAFHNVRRSLNLRHEAGGDIKTLAWYDDKPWLLLLKYAFGSVSTSGSGPYDHTFLLATTDTMGLTVELVKGSHPSENDVAQIFAGCKVNSFEMIWESNEYCRTTAGLIAKSGSSLAAVSDTPAPGFLEEMAGHHVGTLSWNSGTHQLSRFGVRINRGLSRRQYLGSKNTDEPQISQFAEITMFGRIEMVADDFHDAHLAESQGDAVVVITGTGNNRLTVTGDNAKIRSLDNPTDGPGVLAYDFEMDLLADATDRGLKFVVRNDNAAAV